MLLKEIKFDERIGNCLYFNNIPRMCFPNFNIEDDTCELSININDNFGVAIEVKVDECDWREVQLPQDEVVELLKIALKEEF